MEWKRVDIQLEPSIENVFQTIQKIQPNSCIAGGYLSDLYMGYTPKDVDIFIRDHKDKNERIMKCLEERGAKLQKESVFAKEYKYKTAMDVKTYDYEKIEIQLVFTKFGIQAVKHFDYRFREFFHFKGVSYASVEALEDISQKRLVFGVTKAPLVAIHRFVKFKEAYGLTPDENSKKRLFGLFNMYEIPIFVVKNYLKRKVRDHHIKKEMELLFKNETIIKDGVMDKIFYFTNSMGVTVLLKTIKNNHIPRDIVEKCLSIQSNSKEKEYIFPYNPYHQELKERGKDFLIYLEKQKMKLMLNGSQDFVEKWSKKVQEVLDKDTKEIAETYDKLVQELKRKRIKHDLYYTKLVVDSKRFNPSTILKQNTKVEKSPLTNNIISYSNNELMELEFVGLGHVLFNKKRNEIVYMSVDDSIKRQMNNLIRKEFG